jgi:hypothetical protein
MPTKPHKITIPDYAERLAKFRAAVAALPPMPPDKRIEAEKQLAERWRI